MLSLADVEQLHAEIAERVGQAMAAVHRRPARVGPVDAAGLLARREVRVRVQLDAGDVVAVSARLRHGLLRDLLEIGL